MVEACTTCLTPGQVRSGANVLRAFRDSVLKDSHDLAVEMDELHRKAEELHELPPFQVAAVDQSLAFVSDLNARQHAFQYEIVTFMNGTMNQVENTICPDNPVSCPRIVKMGDMLREIIARMEMYNDRDITP